MVIMTVVGKVELVTSEEANLANNASSSIANVPTDLGVDIGGGSGLPLTTPRVGETVDTQDPGAPGHKEDRICQSGTCSNTCRVGSGVATIDQTETITTGTISEVYYDVMSYI